MFILTQRVKRTLVLAAMLAALLTPVFTSNAFDQFEAVNSIELVDGAGSHGGGSGV